MTTVAQALNRMRNGHADILKNVAAGRPTITPRTGTSEIRGYRTALKTLFRWNAIGKDNKLTEFGVELLSAWTIKYNGRHIQAVTISIPEIC